MEVERHAELAQLGQHRQVARVVQEGVAGPAVQERPDMAELAGGAGQLVHRRLRVLPWQGREGTEPGRVGPDRAGHPVVDRPRQAWCVGDGGELHRVAAGQHLHVDAVAVHVGQAAIAVVARQLLGARYRVQVRQAVPERVRLILEPRAQVRHVAREPGRRRLHGPDDVRIDDVFLDADDLHRVLAGPACMFPALHVPGWQPTGRSRSPPERHRVGKRSAAPP